MGGNILVITSFFLTIASVLGEETISPPIFAEKYHVKGVLHIPYADIHEPVEAWYDGTSKQSRIDFYDGTTKTYQLGNIGYGVLFKIVPVTTKTDEIIDGCFTVKGNENFKIVPQTVLPSLKGFKYTGKEEINGESVERWEMNETDYHVVSKYKVLITYKVDPINNEKIAVPIRYEMRGYNQLLGSHCDHYYLEYSSFIDGDIPQSAFEVDPDICGDATGLNLDEHLYTFNPMAEFMRPKVSSHVDSEFEKFKSKHKISYKNENEHIRRKDIFRQNMRYIHSTNRRNLGYSLAINHLADKHMHELKVMRGLRYSKKYSNGETYVDNESNETDIPENYDWRDEGAVSPIKDQAVCGSCWSFSAIGAIEGAYFLRNNRSLVRFSEQALMDCSWAYKNRGCDGGYQTRALEWILHHGSVPTEADYGHYLGANGWCHVQEVPVGVNITGWVEVISNNEDALRSAIFKHGPVSISIDAEPRTFSFYSDGIYNDPECSSRPEKMDHAVLVVGYGSVNGQTYWLVKNSWSTYWGDNGYIKIAAENNICGVMNDPLYVTM